MLSITLLSFLPTISFLKSIFRLMGNRKTWVIFILQISTRHMQQRPRRIVVKVLFGFRVLYKYFLWRFLRLVNYFSTNDFLSLWIKNSISYFRRKSFNFLIFRRDPTTKSKKRMLESFFRWQVKSFRPLRTFRLSFRYWCIKFLINSSRNHSRCGWYLFDVLKSCWWNGFFYFFRRIFCIISNWICPPKGWALIASILAVAVIELCWFLSGNLWSPFDLMNLSLHFSYFLSKHCELIAHFLSEIIKIILSLYFY